MIAWTIYPISFIYRCDQHRRVALIEISILLYSVELLTPFSKLVRVELAETHVVLELSYSASQGMRQNMI